MKFIQSAILRTRIIALAGVAAINLSFLADGQQPPPTTVPAQQPQVPNAPLQQPPNAPVTPTSLLSPNIENRRLQRPDRQVRIKDVTFVEGERVNHVSGVGLVTGLSGTGARAQQTRVMARNYLERQGIFVPVVETINMSAVMVSGQIPPHARPGEKILVTVSVADDATSLRGGTLEGTVLRGIDDQIYAVASGPVIADGIAAQGNAASVTKNHPTVGVCEAIIEREVPCDRLCPNGIFHLVLRNKSFGTATAITNVLNRWLPGSTYALNQGTIAVRVPDSFRNEVIEFISIVGNIEITTDLPARVVINQKTGTIVFGHNVKLEPIVFASENLVISTSESPVASQPAPFSGGQTAVLPRTEIDLFESGGRYNLLPGGLAVGDLAAALNSLAVSPNTMVRIMTTLRNQGALNAELIIE
jgi:flagellar P-ring protein precursor FlgI